MADTQTEDLHRVVVNDEEQYSLWAADRPLPAGWHEAGHTGTRESCLAHIGEVWTDMRPRSVRERHEAGSASAP
ncbi:MbtH family protein [Streptomyces sp. NPDC059957]|uniref:MbtH family protein n=1 Tax=unclassified Streptomyces TaxID=2593676 RepID=UPI003662CF32